MREAGRAAGLLLLFAGPLLAGRAEGIPGRVHAVSGLSAPVEILVDRYGVPHVYARELYDVFFGQGFAAARDRLFQLDLWKRRGEGTLAEAFGSDYVEKDRAARLFLYRGDMRAEWLAYGSDTKRIVTAFVAGVNAYIRLTEESPELLPFEFKRLGYRPGRWTPETVVRPRSHGLIGNLSREVARARFLAEHGKEPLRWRDWLEPSRELEVPDGLDLSAISEDVIRVYELATGSVSFDARLQEKLSASTSALELLATDSIQGSNNWAIAPSRTATGRPILANDPHRAVTVPSLRYISHLSAPGLDVVGAGEPALPGISIGHNQRVAFGLTIFAIDQEDLYVYRTNPDQPEEYWYRDRWEPMTAIEERIPVRGGAPLDSRLLFTRHGPVLHQDRERRLAFAVRSGWLEPGMAPYLGSIEYMRAQNWDQFLAAMNRWGSPSENQVYADVGGNIGWKPGGLAPIRPNWDGLLPVPGDGRYEWAGFRTMDELPVDFNPLRGFLATANQMNLPSGYAHALGFEWALPYRYQRIAEVLSRPGPFRLEDALRLQADYLSLPARRVQATLAGVGAREGKVQKALAMLRDWDGVLDASSASAALFEVWHRRFLGEALMARVVANEGARKALAGGNAEARLRLLENPEGRLGPDPVSARNEVIVSSLAQAIQEAEKLLGRDWKSWSWGRLHQAALTHPLSPLLDERERARVNLGPAPRGGSGETVGNTSYRSSDFLQTSGASFRMVLDVGNWDASLAVNTPGQSGNPDSPHYRDLFELWARDQAFPLLYSREAVLAAAEERIVLQPQR
jgi:penicillin amidase